MPNNFNNALTANIGTTSTTVYTAPANAQVTVIGMSLSNKSQAPVTVGIFVLRGANSFSLVSNATVPVGGSLVPVGIDEKIVLAGGDILQALCNTANAVDSIVSVLEITP